VDQGSDTPQGGPEVQDKSMNRDKGLYQLSHIYDCLLWGSSDTSWTALPKKAATVAETSTSIQLRLSVDEFT